MTEPRILVYPCLHYMQTRDTEKAVRQILFGSRMKLFPGGWSYLEPNRLRNGPVTPANVTSPERAVEQGVAFMEDAQKQWEQAGQRTQLFPVGSGFRLVKREAVQITTGQRRVGWKIVWNVLAHPGRESKCTPSVAREFLLIENAEIVLYIAITGNVIGGSAHWRPTANPRRVAQMVVPDTFLNHLNTARGERYPDDGHGHAHEGQHVTSPTTRALMHYAVGSRTEFRNFVDPYIRFFDGVAHSHGPALVVPVTKFGVHAEILTRARRIGPVASGAAEVEVIPWINMHDGAKSISRTQKGIRGHWTLVSLDDDPGRAPRRVPLTGPLRLRGLYEVALTVQTAQGGISHAHLDVCSALSPKTVFDPDLPVS
jgi:hypothetical protein